MKKPKPAPSAEDRDDNDEKDDDASDDEEDIIKNPGKQKKMATQKQTNPDDKDDEDDGNDGTGEIADGEDFEKRRKQQNDTQNNQNDDDDLGNDESRMADREKMAEMLKYFTPEQMDRYECYRRSSLPKPVLRRVFQAVTGTILNPNGLIVLAAVGKLFVGELVELARQIADDEGVDDLEEIKPAHVREAHRRMENESKLFRSRKKSLFKKRGA